VGPTWPNIENVLKSSPLFPYIFKKNFMHDYDDHEAVYLNCEICVSWARILGPGAGPLLPNSENVLNLLYCQIYTSI
jgi:hypothetical protein